MNETFSPESLNTTLTARPESVQLLFRDFGIATKPTVESIYQAYLAFGDRFLTKLFEIMNNQWANATGEDDITDEEADIESGDWDTVSGWGAKVSSEANKSTFYQKAKGWLDDALSVGERVTALIGGKNTTTTNTETNTANAKSPLSTALIISVAAIILLIIIVLIIKLKK